MEWISVKDKLPDLVRTYDGCNYCSNSVLVSDGKRIHMGCRWILGEKDVLLPDYREGFDLITHWTPLPELPKE